MTTKTKLRPKTVELLEKVKERVLAHPKQVDMGLWINQYSPEYLEEHQSMAKKIEPCGTVACIGGWAIALDDPNKLKKLVDEAIRDGMSEYDGATEARELLHLTHEQAEHLFYVGNWPQKLAKAYVSTNDPKGKAAAVAARIELFLQTDGDQ